MLVHFITAVRSILLLLFFALCLPALHAQTCSGTPAAGTVTAAATMVCAGEEMKLFITGFSAGNDIVVQWQSSPDQAVWTDIADATDTPYVYKLPNSYVTTYYRARVICSSSGLWAASNVVQVMFPNFAQHAALPYAEDFDGDWIAICKPGSRPQPRATGINWFNWPLSGNSSWRREDSYELGEWSSDFGGYTPASTTGDHSARFHSTYGNSGYLDLYLNCSNAADPALKKLSFDYINADGTDKLVVWLSVNGGADFVRLDSALTAAAWTTKEVFFTTQSASVVLRFMGVADNGNSDMGIDRVRVAAAIPCSGSPVMGSVSVDNTTICAATAVNLQLNGIGGNTDGVMYQWQSSAGSTGVWQDVAGAVTTSYATTLTQATHFRVKATCIFDNATATSGEAEVFIRPLVNGSDFTINQALPTGGKNFASFNDAYHYLKCGIDGPVVFTVAAGSGPYHEQLILESVPGASATNTITFNGNSNAIVFSSMNESEMAAVKLRGAGFFHFNNLVINAVPDKDKLGESYGVGVHLLQRANNNEFRNCTILTDTIGSNYHYYGVLINGSDRDEYNRDGLCDKNTFAEDTIVGGQYGVYMTSNVGSPNSNTRFESNVIRDFYTRGVSIWGAASSYLEKNRFTCLVRHSTGMSASVLSYVYIEGFSFGTYISKNVFTHPFGTLTNSYNSFFGIFDGSANDRPSAGLVIINNVFYDICRGENVNGIFTSTAGTAILHNTLDLNYTTNASWGSLTGIRLAASAEGSTLRNNIISIKHNGSGKAHVLYAFTNVVNTDNSAYSITGTGDNYIGAFDGKQAYKTLADWKAITGGDKYSVEADPAFVNVVAGDLHPTERKVNNIGQASAGVTDDITGAARSATAPDPGAYEFVPVGCDPLHGYYTIDQNSPASATNFVSFNAARAALECGVTEPVVFDVKPGSYTEQVVFGRVEGASAVNTITFKGNGNTLQYSSTNTNERAVIKLRGASHFVFDSLTIDAAPKGATDGRYGFGVQFIDDADSNVVKNCNILADTTLHNYSPDFGAIVLTPNEEGLEAEGDTRCDGDSIINNRISGGATSILITGTTTGMVIKDNQVLNFAIMGISLRYQVVKALVEANFISRPSRVEAGFWGIMVWGTGDAANLTVARNTITRGFSPEIKSSGCHAIYVYGMNNNGGISYITNNLIYNMHADGGVFQGITLEKSKTMIVQHNTISIDSVEAFDNTGAYGIYLTYAIDGYITNNLVSITRTGPGQRAAVYFQQPAIDVLFERNNYYLGTASNNYAGIISFFSRYKTLGEWQAVTHSEANTFTINPLFQDITNGDLTPTSEAIDNLGLQRGVLVDIKNRPRSFTTPDMGAFEFTVYPCTAPPEAGKTVVNPTTALCMGSRLQLSLSGNSSGAGQRYVWQQAASATGPWIAISDTLMSAMEPFTTELSAYNYFRCMVTCSGKTDSAEVAMVTRNAGMPSGVYTINPATPTNYPTGKNFASFTAAVNAMACGIEGAVVFRAASGTYNEQVHIPKIGNASLVNTIRFESATGKNTDVILGYTASGEADNYVLKLDSASFVSFHTISIVPGGTVFGNAVVVSGGASWDTISGCRILLPVSALGSNTGDSYRVTGVLAKGITGVHNVIRNNEIVNGSRSIYVSGQTDVLRAAYTHITGNILEKPFASGVEMMYTRGDSVGSNKIHITGSDNTTVYGIGATYTDSVFFVKGNRVVLDHLGASVTAYGVKLSTGVPATDGDSRIEGNLVLATEANAAAMYGLSIDHLQKCIAVNNVININTDNSNSQGLSHTSAGVQYYNNTVQNATANAGAYAAFFFEREVRGSVAKNNIFSGTGGGQALYVYQPDFVSSDYNMLYTTGNVLAGTVNVSAVTYGTLDEWVKATGNDRYSIVYKPAFAGDSLRPDVNSADVWAMHGRGVQIAGNDADFYGAARAVTLQAGVPDLGAYEFLPVSVPVPLTAVPAVPVAGQEQVFYLGTDTVTRIRWQAGSTVPTGIVLRRYSGVAPLNIPAGDRYMYFYTSAAITGSTPVAADVQQYYLNPWQGFIPDRDSIKMGKTDAAGKWVVNSASTVDAITAIITEKGVPGLYQFTGLLNGKAAVTYPVVTNNDSTSAGIEFWASYGHHQRFETDNLQEMQLLIGAQREEAHVTVTIPGTGWRQQYSIAPNTAISSGVLPKWGSYDARITGEGVYNRGIHIVSDVPVQVAALIGRSGAVAANAAVEESGATLLLPTGAYGYEYKAMTTKQHANDHAWSWVNVVAAYDSTLVEITPSQDTRGGHKAGEPYTVMLRKGEVYQVMGRLYNKTQGYDLTGTLVRSAKNASGKCYPVAMFSGSSATSIVCESGMLNENLPVDNLVQQNLPYRAWGKHYITAPFMSHHDESTALVAVYRVIVKDADTKVSVNGTELAVTSLIDNHYYQFQSATADDIVADKPVMVAQYMISTKGCPGSDDDGANDAEVFYLTPVEHGIKKVVFFRHNIGFDGMGLDGSNTVSLIIPDVGLGTLAIDGVNGFYSVYPCANIPGYSQVVKRWNLEGRDASDRNATFTIESDYAYTGITYGLGVSESYGYNLGMRIDTGYTLHNNAPATADTAIVACPGAAVYLQAYTSIRPAAITWHVADVAGITPSADVTETSPVPKDSVVAGGVKYYQYLSKNAFLFSDTGLHVVPVFITDERIEGCDHMQEVSARVYVAANPFVSFSVPAVACVGEAIVFVPFDTVANGSITQWQWRFGDGKISAAHKGINTYSEAGVFDVSLSVTSSYGCIADTVKKITVTDCRTSVFVPNSFTPNGDGNNDLLHVYGVSIQSLRLMIFNQWGQKIFETTSRDEGWDGTYRGSRQPSGVYMYVCTVTLSDGSVVVKKGAVNLVR